MPDPCCGKLDWVAEADLGHASGCDVDLGRCRACGAPLVHLWVEAAPGSTYRAVSADAAAAFLAARGTPDLKPLLKSWLDE